MVDRSRLWLSAGLYRSRDIEENWLYFFGSPGVGKTHAVCSIAIECIRLRVWPVRFWPVPELFKKITDGFRRHDEAARADYDMALACDVLVLDDIGAERESPWIGEQLYLILNHRDGAGLPTLITSNLPLDEMADRLNERARSRIAGRAKPIRGVVGRDRRAEGEI
jgi:DNA replication protein DnaC